MSPLLQRVSGDSPRFERRTSVDPEALADASAIVEEVRRGGEPALRRIAARFGDLASGDRILLGARDLEAALGELPTAQVDLLARVAGRIEHFARAQRDIFRDLEINVPGGRAGHRMIPVDTVGAYAPGGRHSLPSSVLMTAIPARVAGVRQLFMASPSPGPITLAAAALAGVDALVCAGGAHAIAALAFGVVTPPCDVVVGPGNRWVTAAKQLLAGEVGIDGLAGPSEVLVVADESAEPGRVAADLLAQAEHDTASVILLISTSSRLIDEADTEIQSQLSDLPTAATASVAIRNGMAIEVGTLEEAAQISNRIAPEHLSLHTSEPGRDLSAFKNYGSAFVGPAATEAHSDYGIGPNHVLPTGGSARYQSGLSVLTFLRAATWLEMDDPREIEADTVELARLEGLEGHARAALARTR
jgi:phosphoribosyl-ATP pyrophosphohydrolase/phosphoribosyl-AMP cyclohydrolase/histidinol dehydrogenase